jgi:hypothetical protein
MDFEGRESMLKKLRWIIVIPGVLMSVNSTLASATPLSTEGYVENDIFELHTPPQDLAQKDFQSADYKVDHLSDLKPEEKTSLMESGKILYNRDWFLRRLEKNEDPAKTWLQTKWLKEHGNKEPFLKEVLAKYKPDANFLAKEIAEQKERIKRAAKDYNRLVATIEEKRKIPDPSSVAAEDTTNNCQESKLKLATPNSTIPISNLPTTVAPETIAKLSKAVFGIATKQNDDDTKAEVQKQVAAAKNDPSYVTPSTPAPAAPVPSAPLTLKFSTSYHGGASADSAVENGTSLHAPQFHYKGTVSDFEVGKEYPKAAIPSSTPVSQTPVKVNAPGNQELFSIVKDPNSPQTLYSYSSEGITVREGNALVPKSMLHVLRSTDGGVTWQEQSKMTSGLIDFDKHHLAVNPKNGEVYLTGDSGVMVSADGGKTFSTISGSPKGALDVKVSSDGKRLVASFSNEGGVVTFDQDGNGWKKSAVQPESLAQWVLEKFNSDPRCNGKLIVSTCPYEGASNGSTFSTYAVQMDPANYDTIYAGLGAGVYRYKPSTGWELMKNIFNDSTVYNIEAQDGAVTVSTCNGVYRAASSQSDEVLNFKKDNSFAFIDQKTGKSTPGYLRTYDVEVKSDDSNKIVATASSGVYLSFDGGANWKRVTGGALPETNFAGKYAEFRTAVWHRNLQIHSVILF